MSRFTEDGWEYSEYVPEGTTLNGTEYLIKSGVKDIALVATEVNARLIASAPEMYDELYDTLQLLKGKSSYESDEFAIQAKSIEELFARIDKEEAEHE